ncbi:hypothetical protein CHS0354_002205 [Potamilus streckersoni]|uniref:Calpain-5 n=1 Tax=Potamilus streckersoni TaxID=2493646 RepID=A0AAE0RSB8_9BIVA|nr:hypothetical protein CHS0354_002205 [Potamilus streckersoni]
MKIFDNTVPFKGQKYHELKRTCIKKGILFTDPEFPPNESSLCFSRKAPSDIVWKRPMEIAPDAKFFIGGVSSDDFSQGILGNCWFVAACACLGQDSRFWKKIVPDYEEQEWNEKNKYAGIFHFKFWRCGTWIDVVIDDCLPTRNGCLIYMHSKTRNEFWSALLEKAYAKLFGDYESLTAGNAKDALVDMTGGVGERVSMDEWKTEEQRTDLFRILKHSSENRSLISASIAATANELESVLPCGLVKGHAYSVTAVRTIKSGSGLLSLINKESLNMIRCRNPWGGTEWKGSWSDGSPEWKKVSESQKKEMGLTFDDNGEFWMSFEDFCKYFTSMDICHTINLSFFSLKKTWREGKVKGTWKQPDRCGGCGNHTSFLNNPQYIFDVEDDEDEIMVSLEQSDKRVDKDKGVDNYSIGFTILKADLNREYRMHDRLRRISSGPFANYRSVFNRVKLQKGRYLIIPSTFDPGSVGDFILRMYASSNPNLSELVYDEPQSGMCCAQIYSRKPVAVTQITIAKAEDIQPPERGKSSNPYCIIKWEGKTLRTLPEKDTLNPGWNERVTLYRSNPNKDIIIELWNQNIITDQFMGFATIPMEKKQEYTSRITMRKYNLFENKGEKEGVVQKPGGLWLKVIHTDDMSSV